MPDAWHGSQVEHDFCPGGGGTVNQYSESEAGGLTLSDWVYTETSDKITLTEYTGNAVNVVIPSEFAEAPGKSVEIDTSNYRALYSLFDNLKKEDPSGGPKYYNELVSLKIGTTDKKVAVTHRDMYRLLSPSPYESDRYFFTKLVEADLSGLDTSSGFGDRLDISEGFVSCYRLEKVDFSGWNWDDSRWESLFLNCWNLKTVVGMEKMTADERYSDNNFLSTEFQNCYNLNIFDLSGYANGYAFNHYPYSAFMLENAKIPVPTIIITTCQGLMHFDQADSIFGRTPYYAKVVYHSNDGAFADGSTNNEKLLYQSDHFIYSTMAEAKQDFTFTGTEIVKDAPSAVINKEGFVFRGWYLDEACTMPLTETDMIDFMTVEDGTLQLYAGYKEVMPEEPETPEEKPTEPEEKPSEPEEKPTEPQEKPNTPNEEEKEESSIEEIKKEENETVNTGDEVSKGMYYVLLGGSMIVFAAMSRKKRSSEQ